MLKWHSISQQDSIILQEEKSEYDGEEDRKGILPQQLVKDSSQMNKMAF